MNIPYHRHHEQIPGTQPVVAQAVSGMSGMSGSDVADMVQKGVLGAGDKVPQPHVWCDGLIVRVGMCSHTMHAMRVYVRVVCMG